MATLIFALARDGDLEKFSELENIDKQINDMDEKEKYTPLIWASKNGHDDVVTFLLQNGAIVNKCGGWNNSSALMKAAETGFSEVIKILLDHGADTDAQNDFKSTALMLACERSHEAAANLLVQYNSNLDMQNTYGYSALILSAEAGLTSITKLLCNRGANVEIRNMFGKTALIMAAEMGHYNDVIALVNAEADINAQSKRGVTALMLASVKGHHKIVQYLIENNASMEIINNDGDTAITMAVGCNFVEIVKYLLRQDISGHCYTHKNKKGNNALMIAAEKGRLDLVKLFMNFNAPDTPVTTRSSCTSKGGSGKFSRPSSFLFGSPAANSGVMNFLEGTVDCTERNLDVNINETNHEGYSAAMLASKNGHLEVLTYLIEQGADLSIETNGGENAIKVLKNYYVKHEKTFEDIFAVKVATSPNLLEMLPSILPYFSSPNIVLNNCFSSIMMGIKEQTNVVCGLVHVAVALKLCVANHPIEAKDLQERLELVESMLEECMQSDSMDADSNVLQVLHDTGSHSSSSSSSTVQYRNPIVSKAQAFMSGPLAQCIKYKLCSLLGTTQVSSLSDKVFWGYLRSSEVHGIRDISDLFQMRSDLVHIRTCPAAMFFMDGISKLCVLFLVALISYQNSGSDSGLDGGEEYGVCREGRSSTEYFLIFMLLFTVLHEVGELHEVNWNLFDYFDEIWNFFDVAGDSLLCVWWVLSTGCSGNPIATVMLKVSAVPISFSLLRYLSMKQSLGLLVLTIFGMSGDLGTFVVVYCTLMLGFGIAFHGLFPSIEAFSTIYKTMETLFDASVGEHDFSIFTDSPYRVIGLFLFYSYIIRIMIVLMNVVVAQMSATHEKMNDTSFQIWSLLKAKNTQEFLLIQEKSPFSMLPAPLNVIPACLMPLHYLYIHRVTEGRAASKGSSKEGSGSSTKKGSDISSLSMSTSLPHVISICGTASDMTISLLLLLPHTLLEIYYALKHVKQQTSIRTYWTLLILAILFFPLTLCAYTWMLLKRIVEVRSYLKKSEESEVDGDGGYTSLKYEEKVKDELDAEDLSSDLSANVELKLSCIRGKLSSNWSFFRSEDISFVLKFIRDISTKICRDSSGSAFRYHFLGSLRGFWGLILDIRNCFLAAGSLSSEKLSETSSSGGSSSGGFSYLSDIERDHFKRIGKRFAEIAEECNYSLFGLMKRLWKVVIYRCNGPKHMFGKSHFAARFKIGEKIFKTNLAETSNLEPGWHQDKTFMLRDGDLKMNISVLDSSVEGGEQGREVGRAEIDIKSWIANGRFEGDIQLVAPGDAYHRVGTISIAVKSIRLKKSKIDKMRDFFRKRTASSNVATIFINQAAEKVYFDALDKERIFYGIHEGSHRAVVSKALTGYELVTETRCLLDSHMDQVLHSLSSQQREVINDMKLELQQFFAVKVMEMEIGTCRAADSILPVDGVYYRAEGVSADLRSFPKTGPENIRKCLFKIPDAETKEVPSRLVVPEGKRYWTTPWTDYTVSYYITEEVLSNCRNRNPKGWADPEPGIAEDDETHRKLFKPYNPIWLTGIVRDAEGRLLHPYGRTGITGQGVLGNRHVNEAVDPIVLYFDVSCQVLKVLLVKRNPLDMHDNSWAIPGGMVDYIADSDCYSVPQRLGKLLTKFDVTLPKMLGDVYQDVFRELKEETGFDGKVVYQKLLAQMYSDDVRNTDSTWIVTSVFLLIAEDCVAIRADGRENSDATWFPFQEAMRLNFFASHFSMLKAAAKYYVSRSFADRKLQGTEEHRYAYEYLAKIPALNITSSFEKMIGNSDI